MGTPDILSLDLFLNSEIVKLLVLITNFLKGTPTRICGIVKKLMQRGAVQKEKACTVNNGYMGHSWVLQYLSHAPSDWDFHPAAWDQTDQGEIP